MRNSWILLNSMVDFYTLNIRVRLMRNTVTIEEIKDEKEDNYSNDDVFNITSWGADLSFRELISMYD